MQRRALNRGFNEFMVYSRLDKRVNGIHALKELPNGVHLLFG